jgi:carboxymethylenebutenolidase
VGFSLGATLALDLAAQRADLAVAAFYPFPEGQLSQDEKAPPAPIDLADQMNGPIVTFWAEQDEVVPPAGIDRLSAALQARGVEYTAVTCKGVGHGFMPESQLLPGKASSAAALEAWASTCSFLARHLVASSGQDSGRIEHS